METVIQGQITKIEGQSYVVTTNIGTDVHVTINEHTANNGRPSVGEFVVSVIDENGQAILMTRYAYCQFLAA